MDELHDVSSMVFAGAEWRKGDCCFIARAARHARWRFEHDDEPGLKPWNVARQWGPILIDADGSASANVVRRGALLVSRELRDANIKTLVGFLRDEFLRETTLQSIAKHEPR
ncbi:hypothetical protein M3I54_02465 [Paraburkholderia sp. CNPSo 3274]|uniref:hypothetical protein n=1 Tax=Paraburkholderia sp. CNPSo 3274 TaxID=2940932 RepID=UPI0020B70A17|nr:hypothetical protein [Paraburkholderia sp. CNPSo 3274]MCP3705861.1 hypothetical protein [Paraburkholderia sp. CNPSo 3274]